MHKFTENRVKSGLKIKMEQNLDKKLKNLNKMCIQFTLKY